MSRIGKKHIREFEKITREWERLVTNPTPEYLNSFTKHLQHLQKVLDDMHLR